jgi:hypothetical protein
MDRPDILAMSEAELRAKGVDWCLAQLERIGRELWQLSQGQAGRPPYEPRECGE